MRSLRPLINAFYVNKRFWDYLRFPYRDMSLILRTGRVRYCMLLYVTDVTAGGFGFC